MQIQTPYEDAIRRKYPEQVVIAAVKDARGKYNPITLGWTMITSHESPMMAISVGRTRYSLEEITAGGGQGRAPCQGSKFSLRGTSACAFSSGASTGVSK